MEQKVFVHSNAITFYGMWKNENYINLAQQLCVDVERNSLKQNNKKIREKSPSTMSNRHKTCKFLMKKTVFFIFLQDYFSVNTKHAQMNMYIRNGKLANWLNENIIRNVVFVQFLKMKNFLLR